MYISKKENEFEDIDFNDEKQREYCMMLCLQVYMQATTGEAPTADFIRNEIKIVSTYDPQLSVIPVNNDEPAVSIYHHAKPIVRLYRNEVEFEVCVLDPECSTQQIEDVIRNDAFNQQKMN